MPQQDNAAIDRRLPRPFVWRLIKMLWLFGLVALFSMAFFYAPRTARAHGLAESTTIRTVGGTCGTTIQACINSANNGDTVQVPAGTYVESLTLTKTVHLIGINRDTTIVRGENEQDVLTVRGAHITRSVVISGLTFMDGNGTLRGAGIRLEEEASPRLEQLVIRNNQIYGLYLTEGANPHLENLLIRDNNIGGIYAEGDLTLSNSQVISNAGSGIGAQGNVTLSGGEVSQNKTSFGSGGGVYSERNAVIVTNTRFLNNEAGQSGGAISAVVVTATNILVEGNQSFTSGGGILANAITLTNSEVISNVTMGGGGGVSASSAFLYNSDFIRNHADGDGGGATVVTLVVETTRFLENQAGNNGGGISGSTIAITNSQFIANVAQYAGGGVSTLDGTIVRSHFERNVVTNGTGGGVSSYHDQPTNIISASTFLSNTASGHFGGAASFEIINSYFQGNRAGGDYGGAYARGIIAGSQFLNNQAGGDGGGGGSNQIVDSQFQNNQASGNGGGATVYMRQLLHSTIPGLVTRSIFQNNRATDGGGLFTGFGEANLHEVKLIENQASRGGGFFLDGCTRTCRHTIENTLFASNVTTSTGAAMYYTEGNLIIRNSTFAAAMITPKPAIYYYGSCGNLSGCTTLKLNNSIFTNHSVGIQIDPSTGPATGANYYLDYDLFFATDKPISTTETIQVGSHGQKGDPLFVNPAQHNYHLSPGSPAIDKADATECPEIDIEGRTRPLGRGCDIGAYEATPVAPVIHITPTLVSWIAMQGLGPASRPITISNIGADTLNWTASATPGWLSISPANGSVNGGGESGGTANVTVNHGGLAIGQHQGTITVQGNALRPQEQVPTTLEVLNGCRPLVANGDFETVNSNDWTSAVVEGTTLIRPSSDIAQYTAPQPGAWAVILAEENGEENELSQSLKLPGGAPLILNYDYFIKTNETSCANEDLVQIRLGNVVLKEYSLCSANNSTGWQRQQIDISAFAHQTPTLSFYQENDPLGNASVFLLDNVSIPLTTTGLNCSASVLQVTPPRLTFATHDASTPPASQRLTIDNTGGSHLTWQASTEVEWLLLNPSTGTTPATLRVDTLTSGLANGAYNATITITSTGATGSPLVIAVNLVIGNGSGAPGENMVYLPMVQK